MFTANINPFMHFGKLQNPLMPEVLQFFYSFSLISRCRMAILRSIFVTHLPDRSAMTGRQKTPVVLRGG